MRIITRLNSANNILSCKINGESFNIRIEEVCCMEKEVPLQRNWEIDSDSVEGFLKKMVSVVPDSIAECRGTSSSPALGEGGIVNE